MPAGSAVITPEQMWQAIQQARDYSREGLASIKAMEKSFEHSSSEIRRDVSDLEHRERDHHEDHETRLRKIEADQSRTAWLPRAAWGIGSGSLGIIGTILVTLIIDHM